MKRRRGAPGARHMNLLSPDRPVKKRSTRGRLWADQQYDGVQSSSSLIGIQGASIASAEIASIAPQKQVGRRILSVP